MRKIVLLLLFIAIGQASYCGDNSDTLNFKGSLRTSFDYHLQLAHLDITPSILFAPVQKTEVGAGLNYLYYYRTSERTGKSSAGAHAFVRYFPFEKIFLHAEYLYMRVPYRRHLDYSFTKVSVATIMTGGGYRQPFTDKLAGYIYMLIDLNHSDLSAYNSKVLLKAGISF